MKSKKAASKKKSSTKKSAAKRPKQAKAVSAKKASAGKAAPAKKTSKAQKTAKPAKAAKAPQAPQAPQVKKVPRKAGSLRERKIQDIRKRLMDQKESLLSDADVARNALPDQTIFPDLGDQATAETDRNFMLRLRGREQRLIKKIEEAIERIDVGSFGICDMCGCEIGIKRLEVRPVTTLCIECKMEQEEEEKLMGD